MDSRYNGGLLVAEAQHLLPLQGALPTKKFSESESSTGTEATVATTTDDGGDMLVPTRRNVSIGQHDLPRMESIGIGDAILDTVATDERLRDIGGRLSARLEEQQGHDAYDPFRYVQSAEISDENLDLDQLDAGDMFPDDSDDNGIEESASSIYNQRMLPLQDVDESDSDILASSLNENEPDELDYLSGVRTKGVDIHKPKMKNPSAMVTSNRSLLHLQLLHWRVPCKHLRMVPPWMGQAALRSTAPFALSKKQVRTALVRFDFNTRPHRHEHLIEIKVF
jgi:hypothetical protein